MHAKKRMGTLHRMGRGCPKDGCGENRIAFRTTISQNVRTPRKFFLVVLVLVLVLDWVSGLDYEDEDEDEDDSVAAAPLRVNSFS